MDDEAAKKNEEPFPGVVFAFIAIGSAEECIGSTQMPMGGLADCLELSPDDTGKWGKSEDVLWGGDDQGGSGPVTNTN